MAVVLIAGCKGADEYVATDGPVNVNMAYTFNSKSDGGQTRMATVGGILPSRLHIVALNGQSPMKSLLSWNTTGGPSSNSLEFYHFDNCPLAVGVNRCLVYGDTEPSASGAVTYGSLTSDIPTSFSYWANVNGITFSLNSIYSGSSAPTEATTLATALTEVANIDDWKTSDNEVLKNLRKNFTNDGFNLPGSAADVKQWLLSLAAAAQNYYDNPPSNVSETEKTILSSIKSTATTKAEGITASSTSYPRNHNLPDGAAILRWVESTSSFMPQINTTSLDNVNAMWRYAYPAPLYYFCDSRIRTSDSNVNYSSNTTWDSYLNQFPTGDGFVKTTTKAVALSSAVQYAVAQLKVRIMAAADALPDKNTDNITIANHFKLTGIVVCGQRPVNYRFEPVSNSEDQMMFIYDSQVNPDYYLANTTDATEACTTLVLQSYDGENVNIILEFENTSTDLQFKGVDGIVYPNTRFYLIGKVLAPTGDNVTSDDKTHRVFTKDHITTVNVTVSSLANAYSVLPNLMSSNLAIGLEATPQWIAVTPTTIRLE